MKTNLIFGLLSLGFLFASCNRDENSNLENTLILGTWKAKSVYAKSTQGESDITLGACEQKTNYSLNSNGKGNLTTYATDEKGNCIADVPINYSYNYNATKKELTFSSYDGDFTTYKVSKLTNNEMVLEISLDIMGEIFLTKTTYIK